MIGSFAFKEACDEFWLFGELGVERMKLLLFKFIVLGAKVKGLPA